MFKERIELSGGGVAYRGLIWPRRALLVTCKATSITFLSGSRCSSEMYSMRKFRPITSSRVYLVICRGRRTSRHMCDAKKERLDGRVQGPDWHGGG
eukprot:6462254-Pyramimonas_sp.AAC.1